MFRSENAGQKLLETYVPVISMVPYSFALLILFMVSYCYDLYLYRILKNYLYSKNKKTIYQGWKI